MCMGSMLIYSTMVNKTYFSEHYKNEKGCWEC